MALQRTGRMFQLVVVVALLGLLLQAGLPAQAAPVQKLDVVFLIDESGTMISTIRALRREASAIVGQIRSLVPDSAFGAASFNDYPLDPNYGDDEDRPFTLRAAVSTDIEALQAGLNSISPGSGGDNAEAYGRALYELPSLGWRRGAKRVVILLGDSSPHSTDSRYGDGLPDPGHDGVPNTGDDITFTDAVARVRRAGITLVGLLIEPAQTERTAASFAYATAGRYTTVATSDALPLPMMQLLAAALAGGGGERAQGKPAFVTITQLPSPNTSVRPGGAITCAIVFSNRGAGTARNAIATLPFDPAVLVVRSAQFSKEGAWVSRLLSGTLEIQSGPLANGATLTATLHLAILATAPAGARPLERINVVWSDDEGGGAGSSNLPILVVGANESHQAHHMLAVAPASGQVGSIHTFSAAIFAPGEPIALWRNGPDGRVAAVGTVQADSAGELRYQLATTGLAPSGYSLVARGVWSGLTAVGAFTVE